MNARFELKKWLSAPLAVVVWTLWVPYGFEVAFSDFIRESELNSRLGWTLALVTLIWLARRRWAAALLTLPFLLTGLADIYYAFYFGGVFSTETLDAIFHTDAGEASELVVAYLNLPSLLIFLFYVGGYLWLLHRMRFPVRFGWGHRVVGVMGVGALAFAVSQMMLKHRFYDILPGLLGIAPTYAQNAESYARLVADYRQLVADDATPVRLVHAGQAHTYVIVIGEAMTRTHMSLYGYPRRTTPRLDALRDELVVMRDVAAPFVQTRPALKADLFPQSWEHPERDFRHALSIANLARKAGYKVFWLSNQQPFRIPTQLIAETVDEAVFVGRKRAGVSAHRHDGLLLPEVEKALRDPARNKLIFVHLMGSHLQYANRYPTAFRHFTGTPPHMVVKDPLDWKTEKANQYDDSVRYTDWVVGEIDRLLRRHQQGLSGWMLFSDHGEEVFETADLNGHTPDHPTRPMFTIPVVFWNNAVSWQAQHELLNRLGQNVSRPYMADRLFETWLDWLDLNLPGCEGCQYSYLRPYVPRKRMAYGFDIDRRWPE